MFQQPGLNSTPFSVFLDYLYGKAITPEFLSEREDWNELRGVILNSKSLFPQVPDIYEDMHDYFLPLEIPIDSIDLDPTLQLKTYIPISDQISFNTHVLHVVQPQLFVHTQGEDNLLIFQGKVIYKTMLAPAFRDEIRPKFFKDLELQIYTQKRKFAEERHGLNSQTLKSYQPDAV